MKQKGEAGAGLPPFFFSPDTTGKVYCTFWYTVPGGGGGETRGGSSPPFGTIRNR